MDNTSPSTSASYLTTSSVAGPRMQRPVLASKRAPCQGHSIVPSGSNSPADSGMAWCGHSSSKTVYDCPQRSTTTRSPRGNLTGRSPDSGIFESGTLTAPLRSRPKHLERRARRVRRTLRALESEQRRQTRPVFPVSYPWPPTSLSPCYGTHRTTPLPHRA